MVGGTTKGRRCASICTAGKRSYIPIPTRFVVPKHIHMTIIGIRLEPALCGCDPTIDNGTYANSALAQPERERFLLAPIAGVAFNANRHVRTIARRAPAMESK